MKNTLQPVHSVQLKFIVKQNLTDQYIQNWFNQIENSSRGELYGIQLNFFSFEISLFQKFTILNFIHISIGVLPSSPYVIKFGVVVKYFYRTEGELVIIFCKRKEKKSTYF
jgi:hypothetical protein